MPKIDFRSHVIGAADLNKTVTRTINVTQPDGTVKTILQTVKFIRDDQFNEVTGAHNYTDWISNGPSKFSAYISYVIDGYLAPVVKTMLVVPDTGNQVVDVSYVKINVVSHPVYIDAAGHGYNELPAGYHVVAGQTTSNGSMLIAKDFVPVAPKLEFVTRTVVIVMSNGRTRTIKQKVRKGTKFGKVTVPKLRGYKVVVSGDSQELGPTSADRDMNMSVKFVKM